MSTIVASIRERLHDDVPILAGLAATWVVVLLFLARHGVSGLQPAAVGQNLELYAFVLGVIGVIVGMRALYKDRPESPLRYLVARAKQPSLINALLGGLPMLMAMILLVPIFSSVKTTIPAVTSYSWDAAFIAADRQIFGMDAWRALQPVLGHPLITSALSYAYHAWIVLLYAGGVYFCFFVKDREVRAQYFIARFAIWIFMGMAMAVAFASVGPCFVGPLLGNHTFDAQMAYLHQANTQYTVLVLPVQEELLQIFRSGDHGLGGGISAMPSLHVGMSLLSALAAGRLSRLAGSLLLAFTAIIYVASIHLGYHYGVDGIVAAFVTITLWATAGVLARRLTRHSYQWGVGQTRAPAAAALTAA